MTPITYLDNFCKGSSTFQGFIFNGCYNMPPKHFFILYSHFIETGENLLDSYSEINYLSWNRDDEYCHYSQEEYDNKVKLLNHELLKTFFSQETLLDCLIKARTYYKAKIEFDNKKRCPQRTKASTYTSKKRIRELVFKLHGKNCLKCGTEDDISLDHIIPVKKGGKNEIDNLQPLCKTCNSSKGTNIIDYRLTINP